jgi:serine protease
VPLRSSRPVVAAIATGIAASTIAVVAVPAQASVRHGEWWLMALGVRRAMTTSTGAGVTVAVLSDGVNPTQPDLTGSVTTGPDFTGTGQSSGPYFGPLGTGIASIIAGHGHAQGAAAGVMGIAPHANILSVRVTLPSADPRLAQSAIAAGLPDAIAHGIRYAVSHGATVIDLPIDPGQAGVSGSGGSTAAAGGSPAERSAVAFALAHNVVLVAPAGDNGAGSGAPNYPAAYPGVISVGAFGPSFGRTPWTSGQSYVTVTAAGAGVVAANGSSGYQVINSTSAASAVAAGIVAIIRSGFPSLSAAQVRTALITGTMFRHPNGLASGSGYGAVNAVRALTAAAAEIPAADRAGAGSQPWTTLAKPAPQSPQSTVTRQLVTAAAISGGVLLVLLLLIVWYAASRRRRAARQQQVLAAEWSGRQAQPRYPQAAAADADRMLEFFASPVNAPAVAPQRPAGRTGRPAPDRGARPAADRGASAGQGVFAAAGRDSGTIPSAARSAAAGGTGDFGGSGLHATSPWGAPDSGTRSPLGPASRAVGRRPPVSGAPPWEPASQPDGELPWATPEQHRAASPTQQAGAAPRATPVSPTADRTWPGPSVPRHAAPAPASAQGWEAEADYRPAAYTPAGNEPPGFEPATFEPASYEPRGQRMTGRLDWSQEAPGQSSPPAPGNPPNLLQRPGGALPVRQPRQPLQPMSPSGSLWERAVDPADKPAESQDPGSRPIFVWNPPGSTENPPSQSSELTDRRGPDWRRPDWPGTAPG